MHEECLKGTEGTVHSEWLSLESSENRMESRNLNNSEGYVKLFMLSVSLL